MSGTLTEWLVHRAPQADPEELADALWLASLGVVGSAAKAPPVNRPPQPPVPPPPPQVQPPGTSGATPQPPAVPLASGQRPDSRTSADSGSAPLQVPTDGDQPGSGSGLALRTPGGRALPGARELLRALRPFRRRVPARTVFVLDEERTVRNVAETNTWMPMLVPDRSRWLELALVVDESASLGIWRDSLRELRRLLEQLGAFRDVRLWRLDTSQPDRLRLQPGSGGPAVAPGQLLVTDARRVVVVVSDCTGPAWEGGVMGAALATWGRHQPTAILQLLPANFWRRTALDPAQGPAWVEIGSRSAGLANRQLHRRLWRARPGAAVPAGVPIPVFTTAPRDVANWVNLVTRATPTRVPGVMWNLARPVAVRAKAAEAVAEVREPTGTERVLAFEGVASPVAMDLARLLAAAPLRLPVMRLIQQVLLPGSTQVHLAEVFLGGLLRRRSPADVTDPQSVDYEFHPGVRGVLLDSGDANDPLEVQRVVSDYLRERFERTEGGFAAVVPVPGLTGGMPVPALDREFARVQGVVLGRLGGRYREAARQLREVHGADPSVAVDPAPEPRQEKAAPKGPLAAKPLLPPERAAAISEELKQLGFAEAEIAGLLARVDHPAWDKLTQHPRFRELGLHWLLHLIQLGVGATEIGIWRRGRRREWVCELGRPQRTTPPFPTQQPLLDEAFDSSVRHQFVVNTRVWGETIQTILSLTLELERGPHPTATRRPQARNRAGALRVLTILAPGSPPDADTLQWLGRLVEKFGPHFHQLAQEISPTAPAESAPPASLDNLAELWARLSPAQQLAVTLRTTRRYLATDPGESPPAA
jgi:hypothetical protein